MTACSFLMNHDYDTGEDNDDDSDNNDSLFILDD